MTIGGSYPSTEGTEFITDKTQVEHEAAMDGRNAGAYATYRKSLYNKGHAKD